MLEDASVTKVVDAMIERYGEGRAVNVTLNILRKMNQNSLVPELERETDGQTNLVVVQQELRESLMKYRCIYEGKAEQGNQSHLSNIYTEIYIMEGESGPIRDKHEVRKIEGVFTKRQDSA
ncbi:hypothetical protein MATL_G00002690 [Megalops atlanticus]|uniref:Pyrin domain-containing protein n=1 Tax=Megalops atlanticus TaxID=7932 RepID=A0A9D3TJ23_MEGAT|nr:hypothetical protein MATL_G00002690 [Megalops atlanticus]